MSHVIFTLQMNRLWNIRELVKYFITLVRHLSKLVTQTVCSTLTQV